MSNGDGFSRRLSDSLQTSYAERRRSDGKVIAESLLELTVEQ